MICTSALHLYLLTRRNHVSFEGALAQGIGSAIAFSLSILVIWPVTALLVYHLRVSVIRGDMREFDGKVFAAVVFEYHYHRTGEDECDNA